MIVVIEHIYFAFCMFNMPTVCTSLIFATIADKHVFELILSSSQGISKTRASNGCMLANYYSVDGSDTNLVLWEEWETMENYKAYIVLRKETGFLETLLNLLTVPMEINFLTKSTI